MRERWSWCNNIVTSVCFQPCNILVLRGSLHESGLSFNPKRHFKLNSCLHGRLNWGLKGHGEWKSHSGLKLVSDSCTNNLIFPVILALIHFNTWIKLPILQTIFISAIMKVDFIPRFIRVKFLSKFTRSRSPFHFGSSVQSGMKNGMNSIRIHVNKYNSIPMTQLHWNSIWIHVNTP